MNATKFTNEFSEKNYFGGETGLLGLKMVHPHNFGSVLRIFLKFCTMQEAKRYIELMVFLKKSHLGQMGYFGLKMAHCDNSGSTLSIFLKFCIMKGAKRYMKIR